MATDQMKPDELLNAEVPKFSVVIPAYNSAVTLAKAVESVIEQSWPAHEIIIIDDGSTDNTLQVARQFGNRIRLIQQSNGGVSVARNRGADAATGDWLAFLDADDWYYPDRLRWHAEWIAHDSSLDFLTGDYEFRNENGSLTGTSMVLHASGSAMLAKANGADNVVMEENDLEVFVADHFGDMHTLSVPRKTFLELGGYPPGFKVCEDFHFLARLCAVSRRVGVICKPLAVYLIHEASATRSDTLKAQEYNLQALLDLKQLADDFPATVKRGLMTRLRTGRLNLAYALVKSGRKRDALGAVLPSLFETPGWASYRNIMSILIG
jgi:glycosyltransferase involved in cell wall biosynthesis